MPIHDLGYRAWDGERSPVSLRWSVIAATGIRLTWRSRWLRRFLYGAWLPTLIFAMGFFSYEQSLQAVQGTPRAGRSAVGDFMRNFNVVNSDKAIVAWEEDPREARHLVWAMLLLTFLGYTQGTLTVLVVGLVAPRLIAQDFRSRAFLIYFSRSLTPREYVLGKASIVWFFLALITTLPALTLYLMGVLLSPDLSVVVATWDLPLRIVASSALLMIPTTALALVFSSLTTESRYASFSWFAIWIFGIVSYFFLKPSIFEEQVTSHWSTKLSMWHMIEEMQSWIFGLETDFSNILPTAIVLTSLTVVSVFVLLRRVAAPMQI